MNLTGGPAGNHVCPVGAIGKDDVTFEVVHIAADDLGSQALRVSQSGEPGLAAECSRFETASQAEPDADVVGKAILSSSIATASTPTELGAQRSSHE